MKPQLLGSIILTAGASLAWICCRRILEPFAQLILLMAAGTGLILSLLFGL